MTVSMTVAPKAGRKLVSRVLLNRNKKMSEELTKLTEAPTETERAQKQIAQQKKLGRQKELQKKRDEAQGQDAVQDERNGHPYEGTS